MATILLLLDAFRSDYLSPSVTPFLWRCSREGEYYKEVQQSLGFCERTEILTGKEEHESGFLTAIGYDTERTGDTVGYLLLLQNIRVIIENICKLLPPKIGHAAYRRFNYTIGKFIKKGGARFGPYAIPLHWLHYFTLTEDFKDHREADAFPAPSILQLIEDAGKSYFYDSFTALNLSSPYNSDQARLDSVVADLEKKPKDFYLVYVSIMDMIGHKCGPESERVRCELQNLDLRLKKFVADAESKVPHNTYLFLGDHGMLPVEKTFNAEMEIARIVKACGLKLGRDSICFLDSTMVRLWVFDNSLIESIGRELLKSESFHRNGVWMDQSMAVKYKVQWPDRRYGDFLWLAHPGVLVFPDFFHRLEKSKGMHGYDPALVKSKGMCVVWGKDAISGESQSLQLSGVFNILRRTIKV